MHLETEALDVNEVVARLTSREESDKPVDFIQFAKEWIANATLKRAVNYTSVLNSLIRFNKSEKLYTHQITSDQNSLSPYLRNARTGQASGYSTSIRVMAMRKPLTKLSTRA